MNSWNELNSNARVWLYGAKRPFTNAETDHIVARLNQFCSEWAAHGDKLLCGFQLVNNQIILLAVDEENVAASGCSIDTSVQVIRDIDAAYQLDLFQRLRAFVVNGDNIEANSINELKALINSDQVNEETMVVNTMVNTLEDVQKRFVMPIHETWMKQYLKKAAV